MALTSADPARASHSVSRRVVGSLRIAAALLVVASVATQITDQLLNGAFVAAEYFSYFTIQSSLINVVVLAVGGVMAWRLPVDTLLYSTMRMSILAYAVVTAGVYNGLLRGLPGDGFSGVQWPNEVIHVWIPVFIVLDWVVSPGRPALRWTALRTVVVYPLAWLAFTLVRGAVTGWYPYPFLEPATGAVSVTAYIVGISAFIVAVGALAIAWSRRSGASGVRMHPAS